MIRGELLNLIVNCTNVQLTMCNIIVANVKSVNLTFVIVLTIYYVIQNITIYCKLAKRNCAALITQRSSDRNRDLQINLNV